MEENNQNLNADELKKETVETVNQVKDTIKNVNIKNDTKVATSFASSMFKNPIGTLESIVNDNENKHFKTAIIFVIIWTVAVLIKSLSHRYLSFNYLFDHLLSIIKLMIAPTLGILTMSGIVYVFNKNNKKSMVSIITSIVTANIPIILASIISLLTLFSSRISVITTPINSIASCISIVLTYFVAKMIFQEESDTEFIKKFVMIEVIYYICRAIISLLEIYI